MKKKFVLWLARVLKVNLYEEKQVRIVNVPGETIDIDVVRVVDLGELKRMKKTDSAMRKSAKEIRDDVMGEISDLLIKEDLIHFEHFEDQMTRKYHFRYKLRVVKPI